MRSPTQRSLAYLRELGWRAEVVERFIPQTKTRRDLFSCIDILCITDSETLGVQATSGSNVPARLAKIRGLDAARAWLRGNRKLWVVGWRRYAKREGGKLWRPIIREVTLEDVDGVANATPERGTSASDG